MRKLATDSSIWKWQLHKDQVFACFPNILPTLASVHLNISVSSDLYLDQESSYHLSTKWICIRAIVKMSSGELLDRGDQPIGPVPAILGHPLPRVSSYSPFPRWDLEPRCFCKSLYQKFTIGNVCCLGKSLCEMCWFSMGIGQIEPPPLSALSKQSLPVSWCENQKGESRASSIWLCRAAEQPY